MEDLVNLVNEIGLDTALELFIGDNKLCLLKIETSEDILRSKITYLYNDLKKFGLENYPRLKDLLLFVDTKSEVCEIVGTKTFIDSITNQFLDLDTKVKSFYMPLRKGRKSCYFEAILLKRKDCQYMLMKYNVDSPDKYEKLYSSSYKDQVSGLFNLNTLKEHCKSLVGCHYFGFMDLDDFKTINDTLSHDTGDELIHKIGLLMISLSDEHVVFYRRSGDEFIFMTNDLGFEETKELIDKIQKAIRKINFFGFDIQGSMGFAKYEKGIGYDVFTAIKAADLGMYRSKSTLVADPVYISPEEISRIEKESSLEKEIEEASRKRVRNLED